MSEDLRRWLSRASRSTAAMAVAIDARSRDLGRWGSKSRDSYSGLAGSLSRAVGEAKRRERAVSVLLGIRGLAAEDGEAVVTDSLVRGSDARGAALVADLTRAHDSLGALEAALERFDKQSADTSRALSAAVASSRSVRDYTSISASEGGVSSSAGHVDPSTRLPPVPPLVNPGTREPGGGGGGGIGQSMSADAETLRRLHTAQLAHSDATGSWMSQVEASVKARAVLAQRADALAQWARESFRAIGDKAAQARSACVSVGVPLPPGMDAEIDALGDQERGDADHHSVEPNAGAVSTAVREISKMGKRYAPGGRDAANANGSYADENDDDDDDGYESYYETESQASNTAGAAGAPEIADWTIDAVRVMREVDEAYQPTADAAHADMSRGRRHADEMKRISALFEEARVVDAQIDADLKRLGKSRKEHGIPEPARHRFAGEMGITQNAMSVVAERLAEAEPLEAALRQTESQVAELDARLESALAQPTIRESLEIAEAAASIATEAHEARSLRAARLDEFSRAVRLLTASTASITGTVGASGKTNDSNADASRRRSPSSVRKTESGPSLLMRSLSGHVTDLRRKLAGSRVSEQRASVRKAGSEWDGPGGVGEKLAKATREFEESAGELLGLRRRMRSLGRRSRNGSRSNLSNISDDPSGGDTSTGANEPDVDETDPYAMVIDGEDPTARAERRILRDEYARCEASVASRSLAARSADAEAGAVLGSADSSPHVAGAKDSCTDSNNHTGPGSETNPNHDPSITTPASPMSPASIAAAGAAQRKQERALQAMSLAVSERNSAGMKLLASLLSGKRAALAERDRLSAEERRVGPRLSAVNFQKSDSLWDLIAFTEDDELAEDDDPDHGDADANTVDANATNGAGQQQKRLSQDGAEASGASGDQNRPPIVIETVGIGETHCVSSDPEKADAAASVAPTSSPRSPRSPKDRPTTAPSKLGKHTSTAKGGRAKRGKGKKGDTPSVTLAEAMRPAKASAAVFFTRYPPVVPPSGDSLVARRGMPNPFRWKDGSITDPSMPPPGRSRPFRQPDPANSKRTKKKKKKKKKGGDNTESDADGKGSLIPSLPKRPLSPASQARARAEEYRRQRKPKPRVQYTGAMSYIGKKGKKKRAVVKETGDDGGLNGGGGGGGSGGPSTSAFPLVRAALGAVLAVPLEPGDKDAVAKAMAPRRRDPVTDHVSLARLDAILSRARALDDPEPTSHCDPLRARLAVLARLSGDAAAASDSRRRVSSAPPKRPVGRPHRPSTATYGGATAGGGVGGAGVEPVPPQAPRVPSTDGATHTVNPFAPSNSTSDGVSQESNNNTGDHQTPGRTTHHERGRPVTGGGGSMRPAWAHSAALVHTALSEALANGGDTRGAISAATIAREIALRHVPRTPSDTPISQDGNTDRQNKPRNGKESAQGENDAARDENTTNDEKPAMNPIVAGGFSVVAHRAACSIARSVALETRDLEASLGWVRLAGSELRIASAERNVTVPQSEMSACEVDAFVATAEIYRLCGEVSSDEPLAPVRKAMESLRHAQEASFAGGARYRIVEIMSMIAECSGLSDEPRAALAAASDAVDVCTELAGEESMRTCRALLFHSAALFRDGDPRSALAQHAQAVSVAQEVLGRDHPQVACLKNSLRLLLGAARAAREAEAASGSTRGNQE